MKRFIISKAVLYIATIIIVIIIAGCAPTVETVYVTNPLTRPERPVLPKISGQDLQCVSKDTYQKLYDRQRLIVEYAVTLEAIIDSTKNETR